MVSSFAMADCHKLFVLLPRWGEGVNDKGALESGRSVLHIGWEQQAISRREDMGPTLYIHGQLPFDDIGDLFVGMPMGWNYRPFLKYDMNDHQSFTPREGAPPHARYHLHRLNVCCFDHIYHVTSS